MSATIELLYAAEVEAYAKAVINYDDAIARGIPAHYLAKPQTPEPLIAQALRISQQNNFRIGYDKYWHSKRGR